jgi:hypothetical protein
MTDGAYAVTIGGSRLILDAKAEVVQTALVLFHDLAHGCGKEVKLDGEGYSQVRRCHIVADGGCLQLYYVPDETLVPLGCTYFSNHVPDNFHGMERDSGKRERR